MSNPMDDRWGQGYSGKGREGLTREMILPAPGKFLVQTPIHINRTYGKSGLIIPKGTSMEKSVRTMGIVIAVGWDPVELDHWLKLGDEVMYGQYTGAEITFVGDTEYLYRILIPENVFFKVDQSIEAEQEEPSGPAG